MKLYLSPASSLFSRVSSFPKRLELAIVKCLGPESIRSQRLLQAQYWLAAGTCGSGIYLSRKSAQVLCDKHNNLVRLNKYVNRSLPHLRDAFYTSTLELSICLDHVQNRSKWNSTPSIKCILQTHPFAYVSAFTVQRYRRTTFYQQSTNTMAKFLIAWLKSEVSIFLSVDIQGRRLFLTIEFMFDLVITIHCIRQRLLCLGR